MPAALVKGGLQEPLPPGVVQAARQWRSCTWAGGKKRFSPVPRAASASPPGAHIAREHLHTPLHLPVSGGKLGGRGDMGGGWVVARFEAYDVGRVDRCS